MLDGTTRLLNAIVDLPAPARTRPCRDFLGCSVSICRQTSRLGVVEISAPPATALPTHVRHFDELLVVLSGTIAVTRPDGRYVIGPNEPMFLGAGVRCSWTALERVTLRHSYFPGGFEEFFLRNGTCPTERATRIQAPVPGNPDRALRPYRESLRDHGLDLLDVSSSQ